MNKTSGAKTTSLQDPVTTIHELKELVATFRDERNWAKHHSPKNLAVSIAIEAAELMEHFQWDEYTKHSDQKIADELADIIIYCMNFADTMNIDVASAFRDKLRRAAEKYPVEVFNAKTDSPDDYHRIKQSYRRKGK